MVLVAVCGVRHRAAVHLHDAWLATHRDGVSEESAGAQVVLASDMQVEGTFANLGAVKRFVERAIEADPVAVLLVGDSLTPRP